MQKVNEEQTPIGSEANPALPAPETSELAKWKRRALAFQEGYKDKSSEVTGLEIRILYLEAFGVDHLTAQSNDKLKTKLLGVCVERNELREAASILITNAELIDDPRSEGATDCYAVSLDDLETLRTLLASTPSTGFLINPKEKI